METTTFEMATNTHWKQEQEKKDVNKTNDVCLYVRCMDPTKPTSINFVLL